MKNLGLVSKYVRWDTPMKSYLHLHPTSLHAGITVLWGCRELKNSFSEESRPMEEVIIQPQSHLESVL